MSRLRRRPGEQQPAQAKPLLLPQRWALILLASGAAAAVAGAVGGPIAALTVGVSCLVALHMILD